MTNHEQSATPWAGNSETPGASASSVRGGRRLVVVGAVLLIASLLGGALMLVLAQMRYDGIVDRFARAPAGCDTTLVFEQAGSYLVFVETQGRLERLTGGCEAATVYGRAPGARPRVQLSIFAVAGGDSLRLDRTEAWTYDSGGFRGAAHRSVEVTSPGSYIARVQAPEGDEVVIAVGPDPEAAVVPIRTAGLLGGIFGVLLGLGLLIAGLIRAVSRPPAPNTSNWAQPPVRPAAAPSGPPEPQAPPGTLQSPPAHAGPVRSPFERPLGDPLPPPGLSPDSSPREVRPANWEAGRPVTPPVIRPTPDEELRGDASP